MTIKIKETKFANHFFFVSNLSEWHDSCSHEYNREWLQNNPLTKHEKSKLNTLKKILKKYGVKGEQTHTGTNLGKYFYVYSQKAGLLKLQAAVTRNEYTAIQDVLRVFKPRFEAVWKATHDTRVSILTKMVSSAKFAALLKDITYFFDSHKTRRITVVLLYSPLGSESTARGSSNPGDNTLTLEYPNLKRYSWQIKHAVGILIHHIIHILFRPYERTHVTPVIRRLQLTVPQSLGIPAKKLLQEAIVCSFAPTGFIMQRYFNYSHSCLFLQNLNKAIKQIQDLENGKTHISIPLLVDYIVWELVPLTMLYVKKRKQIDTQYIHKIGHIIQELQLENFQLKPISFSEEQYDL